MITSKMTPRQNVIELGKLANHCLIDATAIPKIESKIKELLCSDFYFQKELRILDYCVQEIKIKQASGQSIKLACYGLAYRIHSGIFSEIFGSPADDGNGCLIELISSEKNMDERMKDVRAVLLALPTDINRCQMPDGKLAVSRVFSQPQEYGLGMVRLLLEAGVDPNVGQDPPCWLRFVRAGTTFLEQLPHQDAEFMAIMEMMVGLGAKLNQSSQSKYPISLLISKHHTKLEHLLLLINSGMRVTWDSFDLACAYERVALGRELIFRGAHTHFDGGYNPVRYHVRKPSTRAELRAAMRIYKVANSESLNVSQHQHHKAIFMDFVPEGPAGIIWNYHFDVVARCYALDREWGKFGHALL